MDNEKEKITIRLPQSYIEMIDFLVSVDYFQSRSEAIRFAVRDMIFEKVKPTTEALKQMQEAKEAVVSAEEVKEKFLRR